MTKLLVGIAFFGFIALCLGLMIWLVVHASRRATLVVNSCRRCGYDLRRLSERRACPECGTPFHINEKGQPVS